MIRLIVTLFENTHKNSIKNWFLPTIEVLKYDANRREKEQQFVYYTTYNEEKDDFFVITDNVNILSIGTFHCHHF